MGLFSKRKKEKKIKPIIEVPKRPLLEYSFKVAGVPNYKKAIKALAEYHENDWYTTSTKEIREAGMDDERIYQYDFNICKVDFVDEPDNPYDKNAIKIIFDDEHIGYVPKTKCTTVKNILSKEIKSVYGELYGGKYKYVSSDGTDKNETKYGASVTIYYYEKTNI